MIHRTLHTLRTLALAVALAIPASVAVPEPATVGAASYPADLVWMGLGDSYSSGEGLRYVDAQANPPDKDCQRATGTTTVNKGNGSRAYAKVAYDLVRGGMTNSTFALLACTGAVTNEIHDQYREWFASHPGTRADLITLSMGGNNLGFADTVLRCIGLAIDNSTGAGIILNPAIGCDTTEAELKAKVDQLVGTSGVGPDGGQTLRDMYQEIAMNAINRGGHVIVTGYPNIVEESGKWVMGWLEGNRCHRIRRADASMLRSVVGYLNQQIALLVDEMDGKYRDVSFDWVDTSQVYENDSTGHHGLCTGDPWVNGLTLGALGPHDDRNPLRWQRSYHPTQDGHDQLGRVVADLVAGLSWDKLNRAPDPVALSREALLSATVPAMCGHLAGQLVDGSLPPELLTGVPDPGYLELGELTSIGDADGDGRLEIAAQFQCSQGGVSWPDHVVVFRDDLSVVGDLDLVTLFPDVWRGGLQTLAFTGDHWEGTAGIERTGADANSYTIEPFTLDIDAGVITAAVPQVAVTRELVLGDTGDDVRALQAELYARGHTDVEVDGIFGPATETAVFDEQEYLLLDADGRAGPTTIAALGLGANETTAYASIDQFVADVYGWLTTGSPGGLPADALTALDMWQSSAMSFASWSSNDPTSGIGDRILVGFYLSGDGGVYNTLDVCLTTSMSWCGTWSASYH